MSLILLPAKVPVSGAGSVPIGQTGFGGTMAGKMSIGGELYAIFVSPASGIINNSAFKTAGTTNGAIAQVTNDGWGICQSLTGAGYPVLDRVRALTIGGYNDWYIPSRDEMEMIYRNLGANAASATFRTRTPAGQLGDVAGVGDGNNAYSYPPKSDYSVDKKGAIAGSPVPLTEASVWMSCTEVTGSPTSNWGIIVGGGVSSQGHQSDWAKSSVTTTNFFYRAIRREKI